MIALDQELVPNTIKQFADLKDRISADGNLPACEVYCIRANRGDEIKMNGKPENIFDMIANERSIYYSLITIRLGNELYDCNIIDLLEYKVGEVTLKEIALQMAVRGYANNPEIKPNIKINEYSDFCDIYQYISFALGNNLIGDGEIDTYLLELYHLESRIHADMHIGGMANVVNQKNTEALITLEERQFKLFAEFLVKLFNSSLNLHKFI